MIWITDPVMLHTDGRSLLTDSRRLFVQSGVMNWIVDVIILNGFCFGDLESDSRLLQSKVMTTA